MLLADLARWVETVIMGKSIVLSFLMCLLALTLAGCDDEATLPEEAGTGPQPKLPRTEANPLYHRQYRPGKGLACRREANGSHRLLGECLCEWAKPSTLALCAAKWGCASRRNRCPTSAPVIQVT